MLPQFYERVIKNVNVIIEVKMTLNIRPTAQTCRLVATTCLFYNTGIKKLPVRWEKYLECNRKYVKIFSLKKLLLKSHFWTTLVIINSSFENVMWKVSIMLPLKTVRFNILFLYHVISALTWNKLVKSPLYTFMYEFLSLIQQYINCILIVHDNLDGWIRFYK